MNLFSMYIDVYIYIYMYFNIVREIHVIASRNEFGRFKFDTGLIVLY